MKVEYLENKHQYIIDGKIVPAVSTLVAYATGNIYSDVPEFILEKARVHGLAVHDAIENYERTGVINEEHAYEVRTYADLKEKYLLNVKDMEQIIHYKNHYGGRYDILDLEGNLWDIKTTSKFHKRNLEWQLGLYYLGMGVERDIGYCIHIPKKGKAKVYAITPRTNAECIDLVNTYEQANKSTTDTEES